MVDDLNEELAETKRALSEERKINIRLRVEKMLIRNHSNSRQKWLKEIWKIKQTQITEGTQVQVPCTHCKRDPYTLLGQPPQLPIEIWVIIARKLSAQDMVELSKVCAITRATIKLEIKTVETKLGLTEQEKYLYGRIPVVSQEGDQLAQLNKVMQTKMRIVNLPHKSRMEIFIEKYYHETNRRVPYSKREMYQEADEYYKTISESKKQLLRLDYQLGKLISNYRELDIVRFYLAGEGTVKWGPLPPNDLQSS